MIKLRFTIFIFFCLLIFSQSSYCCSCLGTNFRDISTEGIRKYYQKESNLIIFTGKVLAVKKVKVDRQISPTIDDELAQTENQSNFVFQRVLTVKTDKFWLGNPESELTVNTGMDSTDCGINLSEGDEFFFIARKDEDNKLWIGICDYSLFPEFDAQKLSDKFTEIFGTPKTSKK